jgi:hypothetical protein
VTRRSLLRFIFFFSTTRLQVSSPWIFLSDLLHVSLSLAFCFLKLLRAWFLYIHIAARHGRSGFLSTKSRPVNSPAGMPLRLVQWKWKEFPLFESCQSSPANSPCAHVPACCCTRTSQHTWKPLPRWTHLPTYILPCRTPLIVP